tara:strand:- start:2094 stop:2414 length:321 start_codon:yes stop_codon:yes gene_type:complete
MAITRYHNVAGATAVTNALLSAGQIPFKISSILITNTHSSNAATITLFIQRSTSTGTETFKITSLLDLPAKTSLLLDDKSLLTIPSDFGLFITVGSSDTVDVLINS